MSNHSSKPNSGDLRKAIAECRGSQPTPGGFGSSDEVDRPDGEDDLVITAEMWKGKGCGNGCGPALSFRMAPFLQTVPGSVLGMHGKADMLRTYEHVWSSLVTFGFRLILC